MTDQERTALHESSHHVICAHFGLASYPELTPGGFTVPGSAEVLPVSGVCCHDIPNSKFRRSVIAWAGIIGPHLEGGKYPWSPPVPLAAKYLRDWYLMFLQKGFDQLSQSDQLGIMADPKRTWRSFKTAWKILLRNRARLRQLAGFIMAAGQPTLALDNKTALRRFLEFKPADYPGRQDLERALANLENAP